ncbi:MULTISPECIES: hypothetical protein [Streptomyces]|uniref:DUF4229 domain-containing protein n=1 Tax=Streptomyces dengpaensis TaxID=2049881 RepID=A0ABN5I5A2_9ACTN|nr:MULTISPECIES: hypothetical protein [Streptomyces]AVH58227.1 hypothetical protein C4B68_23415 [Streptomyces dengpaensis]PIB08090.1 hypothetical protein B1C81_16930 [Streptomyces sp. HG99]
MLGLLLRVLPFWIREPLLVIVGLPFGVLLVYAAVRDEEWIMAALGVAVLAITAARIHTIVNALRARRMDKATNSASAEGA